MPAELYREIYNIRTKRNLVAHGRSEVTKKEVTEAIKVIENLEGFLSTINDVRREDEESGDDTSPRGAG